MLETLQVFNKQGQVLLLPLQDNDLGFCVEQIEGLEPVKATMASSSFARLDGEQFQFSRRETRNIKLRLGLEPDHISSTVSSLRQALYGFFMPKTEVGLRFIFSDGLQAQIVGRTESFESPLFVKEPAVDISIICFDPDFTDVESITVSADTTATTTETELIYSGTTDVGMKFTIGLTHDVTEFTIYHRSPEGVLTSLEFAAPLLSGDILTINTQVGEKGAYVSRGGAVSSVLYGVSPQSKWLQLSPGTNYIRIYETGAASPFDVDYANKYGGL